MRNGWKNLRLGYARRTLVRIILGDLTGLSSNDYWVLQVLQVLQNWVNTERPKVKLTDPLGSMILPRCRGFEIGLGVVGRGSRRYERR